MTVYVQFTCVVLFTPMITQQLRMFSGSTFSCYFCLMSTSLPNRLNRQKYISQCFLTSSNTSISQYIYFFVLKWTIMFPLKEILSCQTMLNHKQPKGFCIALPNTPWNNKVPLICWLQKHRQLQLVYYSVLDVHRQYIYHAENWSCLLMEGWPQLFKPTLV